MIPLMHIALVPLILGLCAPSSATIPLTVKLNINLYDCIKGIDALNAFFEHYEAAGLRDVLKEGKRGHTVIAVINDGFHEHEAGHLTYLSTEDRLKYIKNTVIEGKHTAPSLAHFAGALHTMAGHRITCHAYHGGVYTINGGLVLKQYLTNDGVLIVVDRFHHHYDEPLLVSLGVKLLNTHNAHIFESAIETLQEIGHKFDECTMTIPPEIIIEKLAKKPELLLHYVFSNRYYPIDFKFTTNLISYAGIRYHVKYVSVKDVRIGKHSICDLTEYRVSTEGILYQGKQSEGIDVRGLFRQLELEE